MGNNPNSGKKKKPPVHANWLEAVKDTGLDVAGQVTPIAENLFEQVLGFTPGPGSKGELKPGQSLEIGSKIATESGVNAQAFFEKQKGQFEVNHEANERQNIQIRINQLLQELQSLLLVTADIGQEAKVASMQAIVEPGEYHVGVLEHLINIFKDFRVQAESALTWLQSNNSRAQKKNFWNQFKNKKTGGSNFLLSGEHYMTRSAG